MERRPKKTINRQDALAAIDLFKNFTGMEPEYVDTVKFPVHNVAMVLGECDGVLYTTVREGKTEKYIHKFKKKSRPLLVVSSDGKQLYVIGGSYRFTERGIEDKT